MVKMVIGEVQAQTSEVKSYCNKMIQNLESVSNATSSIGLAVGLQGQAFQSIKSYLSTAYPALAKALILYSESVATANENYLQAYTGKFGAKDLDSDKLQHQIEEKNRLLQELHDQKESIESFQRNLPASAEVFFRAVCREMIQTLSSSINRNMAAKSKLEKKLEDFLEFNSHSPSYFEEANSLYGTVNSALSSLGVGKDGQISTGSWNGHGFNSFSNGWMTDVNKKWADREQQLEKERIASYDLVKTTDTMEEAYQKYIKYGNMGIHPHTGAKLSDKEAKKFIYAADMGTLFDVAGLVGGAYYGQKAVDADFYQVDGVNKKVTGADVPKSTAGVVQSRINIAENPTRFSPSKNAGMKHVRDRHFNPSKNAGQFTISESDLKAILQSKPVVNTPVKQIESGGFERVLDVEKTIGTVKPSLGGEPTTRIKIITDKAGNIITTYPIPKP